MGSIEERLDREDWTPMPGDQLIGTITSIAVRYSRSGSAYPVLVIQNAEGTEYTVSCALMAADVIAHRPVTGERVGVKFHGPQDKSNGDGTWDKYSIAFEKEPPVDVDWDAMASSRRTPAVPTDNPA